MRRTFAYCRALFLLALPAAVLAARVGEPAPNFTATDSNGKTHSLADYKGKLVVLEWHNQGCPFTPKHYQSGNMQRLHKDWVQKGVVWLTVISSAPGTQGYVTAQEENDYLAKNACLADSRAARSDRGPGAPLRRKDDASHVSHQSRWDIDL